MSQIIQLVLDMLGMSRREQLILLSAMMVLGFALYAGKQFAAQKVYATLYLVLGLALCVFMLTENAQTRLVAALALCGGVIALFTWYFLTTAGARRSDGG